MTSWRRTDGTLLLRPLETSLLRSNKTLCGRTTETFWRPFTEKSLCVSFESIRATSVGHTKRFRYSVSTASFCWVGGNLEIRLSDSSL